MLQGVRAETERNSQRSEDIEKIRNLLFNVETMAEHSSWL
jgi:hypothetical protein